MLRGFVLVLAGAAASCAGGGAGQKGGTPPAPESAPAPPEPAPAAPEPAGTASVADAGSPQVPAETAPSGSCTVGKLETVPTKESRNDQCRGTFYCPGARTVQVICDGENDGTNTSLCDCEEGGKRASLSTTVPGEAPESCVAAADRCAQALAK